MPITKNVFEDKISLVFNNGLIIGHAPELLTLEKIIKKMETEQRDVEALGFFDTASPNYHTYYPEVTPEDLTPDEDTFIRPTFRALSKVIVHRRFNPIDFGKGNVLRDSLDKLVRQTVNIDHEHAVGNAIGSIASAVWQSGYTSKSGQKVPAGINTVLLIDGKSHPNIARKIMMDPPAIHSTSVTVKFAWEPSHEFDDVHEFFRKIGQFNEDGELIRRVVTEIKAYDEISLVGHGADPYAQIVKDDGQINNPEYADSVLSLAAQGKEKPQVYGFDYKTETLSLSEKFDNTIDANNNDNPNKIKMKEYLLKLAASFKLTDYESMDEAALQAAVQTAMDAAIANSDKLATTETELETGKTELSTAQVDLATEKTAHTELKEKTKDLDLDTLNSIDDLDDLQATAASGVKAMELQLAETERLYKLLNGDDADKTVLESYKKMDFETLTAQTKDLTTQLEKKFPGKCNDCQSTNVARNSTITKEGLAGENDDDPPATSSDTDVMESFRDDDFKTSSHGLHGPAEKKKD